MSPFFKLDSSFSFCLCAHSTRPSNQAGFIVSRGWPKKKVLNNFINAIMTAESASEVANGQKQGEKHLNRKINVKFKKAYQPW